MSANKEGSRSMSRRSADIRRIKSAGDISTGPSVDASRDNKDQEVFPGAIARASSTVPPSSDLLNVPGSSVQRPPSLSLPPPDPPALAHTATNTMSASSRAPSLVGTTASHNAQQTPEHTQTDLDRIGHQHREHNLSLYTRTMAFFGYGREGSRNRRAYVSLLWNLASSLAQIVVIATFVGLSKSTPATTMPELNQWDACDRPLGIWACLWIVRVVFSATLAYWGYQRDRHNLTTRSDPEAPNTGNGGEGPGPTPFRPGGPASRLGPRPTGANATDETRNNIPHSTAFRRYSLVSSMFSLAWLLVAHIFEYTSVNTCRVTSPYLWWLIFGILCITYLMIVEVVILGIIVFVLAPIVFVLVNIVLMCFGRHPIQHPGIRPEIGKLPADLVDQIPLVMYIPPPPESEGALPLKDGLEKPKPVHSYPPQSEESSKVPKRNRFRFLRRKGKGDLSDAKKPSSKSTHASAKRTGPPTTWEEHFEPDGYPFVVLESNRAACAICLMDFEEPKRYVSDSEKQEGALEANAPASAPSSPTARHATGISEELRLEDAGEGPQPLRLLDCGHVFHRPCLDPWLTTVSGRCPVCQKVVDVPPQSGKKKGRPS